MLRRLLLAGLSGLLSIACGATALPDRAEVPVVSLGGAANRRIATLTDLEEVRDVATLDGMVFVATDMGLMRYGVPDDPEIPADLVEGLPSADVRALAVDEGNLWIATAEGLARYASGEVTVVDNVPDVGQVQAFTELPDGTLFLCGLGGLARRQRGGGWEAFGHPHACTSVHATEGGQLWVGHTEGALYVDGDVVREHRVGQGIPEGYVRAVVPTGTEQALALVQGPTGSMLAFWDGQSWISYIVPGLNEPLHSLVRHGDQVYLAAQYRLLSLEAGVGSALTAFNSTEGTVSSYRAAAVPAHEHTPADMPQGDVLRDAQTQAELPEDAVLGGGPGFGATDVEVDLHGSLYHAVSHGPEAFLAIANGGVIHMRSDGAPRVFRTRTLVPEGALQTATDARGGVWALSRDKHLTKFRNDRLIRVGLPDGINAQALASGPQGAVMVATIDGQPNVVQTFVNAGDAWRPFLRREMDTPSGLTSVPFVGVDPNRVIWIGLEVSREEGEGTRMRGVAVLAANSEEVVYHHRGASGEGALRIPDEVSAITFDTDYAWLASLSGAIRIGNEQAVVYGEARGVAGELVYDIAVGNQVIWLASGEGIGQYDRRRFSYAQPDFVQATRPTSLAVDLAGHLWGASNRGLVFQVGEEWMVLTEEAGMPTSSLVDVDVDGAGRVWVLAADRLLVLEE